MLKEVKKDECVSLVTRSLTTFNKLSLYWPPVEVLMCVGCPEV